MCGDTENWGLTERENLLDMSSKVYKITFWDRIEGGASNLRLG